MRSAWVCAVRSGVEQSDAERGPGRVGTGNSPNLILLWSGTRRGSTRPQRVVALTMPLPMLPHNEVWQEVA